MQLFIIKDREKSVPLSELKLLGVKNDIDKIWDAENTWMIVKEIVFYSHSLECWGLNS